MKIVFTIASMLGGGAERVVSELANNFAEQGHSVSIIVTKQPGCVYYLNDNVKLMDLSVKNRGILSRIKAVRECFSENDYDIIISFLTSTNNETILSRMGKKIPLIISERNNPYVEPRDKMNRTMRKFLYPFADGYVFQTPDARAYFNKRIQRKSTVIMNPINPKLPQAFCGERSKRIVSVGRLVPQKNHKMLIDAFGEFMQTYSDYRVEIYGEGPLKTELQEYIRSKGLENKVILCGFSNNVTEAIADASMFILSSDYEGMSNALIEAVGMGIPCISTDHPIGGARMTIQDGVNGFLVPVGDVHSLAEKMLEIAENNELAQNISKQGVQLRNTLSIEEIAKQWFDYISMVK